MDAIKYTTHAGQSLLLHRNLNLSMFVVQWRCINIRICTFLSTSSLNSRYSTSAKIRTGKTSLFSSLCTSVIEVLEWTGSRRGTPNSVKWFSELFTPPVEIIPLCHYAVNKSMRDCRNCCCQDQAVELLGPLWIFFFYFYHNISPFLSLVLCFLSTIFRRRRRRSYFIFHMYTVMYSENVLCLCLHPLLSGSGQPLCSTTRSRSSLVHWLRTLSGY